MNLFIDIQLISWEVGPLDPIVPPLDKILWHIYRLNYLHCNQFSVTYKVAKQLKDIVKQDTCRIKITRKAALDSTQHSTGHPFQSLSQLFLLLPSSTIQSVLPCAFSVVSSPSVWPKFIPEESEALVVLPLQGCSSDPLTLPLNKTILGDPLEDP